jgi:hexokinase
MNVSVLNSTPVTRTNFWLIDEGVLFLGQNTYKLENPYVFDTAFLSLMAWLAGLSFLLHLYSSVPSDPTDELLMIIGIFSHFFAVETTLAERQFFRALAKLIGRRAARLSAVVSLPSSARWGTLTRVVQ